MSHTLNIAYDRLAELRPLDRIVLLDGQRVDWTVQSVAADGVDLVNPFTPADPWWLSFAGVYQYVRVVRTDCQIADPTAADRLPCSTEDSHGTRCERLDPHTDGHAVTEHTQRHAALGNGYACEGIR